MPTQFANALPVILLIVGGIGAVGCLVYLFTHTAPLTSAVEYEAQFQAYLAREVRKAQVGAANADQWAKDLITHWQNRRSGV